MMNIVPPIIKRSEIHNPDEYYLNKLEEIPIIKKIFIKWIENKNIIPLTIRPLWNYMKYKDEDDEVNRYKKLSKKSRNGNFEKLFKEVLDNNSKDEFNIQRKLDSINCEIDALYYITDKDIKKIDTIGDWETESEIISVKTKFHHSYNLFLIERLLFGLATIEENDILRQHNYIRIKFIDRDNSGLSYSDLREIRNWIKNKLIGKLEVTREIRINKIKMSFSKYENIKNNILCNYITSWRINKEICLENVLDDQIKALNDNYNNYKVKPLSKKFVGMINVYIHPEYGIDKNNQNEFTKKLNSYLNSKNLDYRLFVNFLPICDLPNEFSGIHFEHFEGEIKQKDWNIKIVEKS